VRRRRAHAVGGSGLLLAALVIGEVRTLDASPLPQQAVLAVPAPASAPPAGLADYRVTRPDEAPRPVRLRVPDVGVDSALGELGQAPDRTVEVPSDPGQAGWYALGPRPGQPGPAVLLGHVDGRRRPGVFFRLPELQPGALVLVDRADGTLVTFRVTRLERMPKTSFPTGEVYLPTSEPELRLVTCGGNFDGATGHYRDNVIAYAVLAG
jgi:hypothetical protein